MSSGGGGSGGDSQYFLLCDKEIAVQAPREFFYESLCLFHYPTLSPQRCTQFETRDPGTAAPELAWNGKAAKPQNKSPCRCPP